MQTPSPAPGTPPLLYSSCSLTFNECCVQTVKTGRRSINPRPQRSANRSNISRPLPHSIPETTLGHNRNSPYAASALSGSKPDHFERGVEPQTVELELQARRVE